MCDVSDLATGNYKVYLASLMRVGVYPCTGTQPAHYHFLEGVQPKTQKPPQFPHPSHALGHVVSMSGPGTSCLGGASHEASPVVSATLSPCPGP